MLVSLGFISFGNNVYPVSSRGTPLLSFFINSLSCHKKIICDRSFNKNETLNSSSLRIDGVVNYGGRGQLYAHMWTV
jgi:hypothetical protein